jgi:hypothetical protein
MADIKTAQIVSQEEGPEKRSVLLTLRDDGSIQMYTSDDSQAALKIWAKKITNSGLQSLQMPFQNWRSSCCRRTSRDASGQSMS